MSMKTAQQIAAEIIEEWEGCDHPGIYNYMADHLEEIIAKAIEADRAASGHDALLAALEEIMESVPEIPPFDAVTRARAAIAKAKGDAS
jgi:hypothetical protein